MYDSAGRSGNIEIVGDHHNGISHVVQLFKQLQDFFTAAAVQRAGGLVGEKKRGIPHQSPRDGRPLLLSAGQFRRIVSVPYSFS